MPRFIPIATAREIQKIVEEVEPTVPSKQLEFLERVARDEDERRQFLKDPEGYLLRHEVVLDPDVVKVVTDTILFEPLIPDLPFPRPPEGLPPEPEPPEPPLPKPWPRPDPPPPVVDRLAERYDRDDLDIFERHLDHLADRTNPHAWPAAVAAIAAVVAAGAAVASAVCGCSSDSTVLDAMKGFNPKSFREIGPTRS